MSPQVGTVDITSPREVERNEWFMRSAEMNNRRQEQRATETPVEYEYVERPKVERVNGKPRRKK